MQHTACGGAVAGAWEGGGVAGICYLPFAGAWAVQGRTGQAAPGLGCRDRTRQEYRPGLPGSTREGLAWEPYGGRHFRLVT